MSDEKENNVDSSDNGSRRGGISVETQHIFPIIKKWLYSDKDIFMREIVSNASDAVTKLRRLKSLGHADTGETDWRITVRLDKNAGTISVEDNGIGMTREEVEKYICSIALSGALDFVAKYENGDNSNGIIGHFGLGFYSSFMVSDTVEINTRSYTGAPAVHWVCTEAGEYEISDGDREARGTEVIMHISEDEKEYLDASKLRTVLNRYCSFMPVAIYFDDGEEHKDEHEHVHEHAEGETCECEHEDAPKPINDTTPLWAKKPSDITPEQYIEFYHKLFLDANDPLFWVHINADYPLNFKGILFFPKINSEYQSLEGQVKLYYNQVFVADNIKEVIPEYLLMLRGAIDCPELPLNVSRSYLQDNAYVKKVSAHIVKKVADKLCSLANTEREKYEKVYPDIRIFIEYACLRDRKFFDRVKDTLLIRLSEGSPMTFAEYLEKAKEKHEGKIYYTSDTALQAQYISMFRAEGIDVAVYDLAIDTQFMASVEQYRGDVKFVRVDAGIDDALKAEKTEEGAKDADKLPDDDPLTVLFRKVSGDEKLTVKTAQLKNAEVPALLTVSEESRRFADMMKLYSAPGEELPDFPVEYTLSLNLASHAYARLKELMAASDTDAEKADAYAAYIYRLALIAQKKLTAKELEAFLADSYRLLGMI